MLQLYFIVYFLKKIIYLGYIFFILDLGLFLKFVSKQSFNFLFLLSTSKKVSFWTDFLFYIKQQYTA